MPKVWNVFVEVIIGENEADPNAVARDAFTAIESSFEHIIEHELLVHVTDGDPLNIKARLLGRPKEGLYAVK